MAALLPRYKKLIKRSPTRGAEGKETKGEVKEKTKMEEEEEVGGGAEGGGVSCMWKWKTSRSSQWDLRNLWTNQGTLH